jgi:hypothetical protein
MRWLQSPRCISIIAMEPLQINTLMYIIGLRRIGLRREVRDMVARMVVDMRVDMEMETELPT